MAKFYLKYNPYKIESTMKYNQKDISPESQLYAFKNERLQLWGEKLFDILFEELNTQNIKVIFEGTELDYNYVNECAKKAREKNSGLKIKVKYIPGKKNEDLILCELKKIFEELQNGPFETLRDPKLKESFEKALGSEFEVNVIATMSSGKSTLINSLLGQELMPAKNEACTATIGRIKAVPNQKIFTGTCYDKNQNQLCDVSEVNRDKLKEFNENEKVSEIHLEGEIPFSNSSKTNLILIDTPGPNNSRDRSHREKTFSIIKDKSAKNLVLYVLNATQLKTNDDQYLLKTIAEAMQVGGKQSKDRFMFVVNKLDTYDIENGDSVKSTLDNVRQYLKEECGIENPNIFLASAEFAKVIRLHQQNQKLTVKQDRILRNVDLLNAEELHLEKYAPIQESRQREFEKQIKDYRKHQDVESEALIHTGIPAIEVAINDYLEKYAFSSKISTTVGTFKQEIDKIMLKEDLKNRIDGNVEEKERLEKLINKLSEQIKDGKLALSFKNRIMRISVDKTKQEITKLERRVDKTLQGLYKKAKFGMSESEVHRLTNEAEKLTNNIQADVVAELNSIVNNYLIHQGQQLLSEYTETVMSVFEEDILLVDEVDRQALQFVLSDLPDAYLLVDNFMFEAEGVIRHRRIRNESKKWYNPFTWFQPKYYFEDITGREEFYDGVKLVDEFIDVTIQSVHQTTQMAKKSMDIQAKALKQMFIDKIDELEHLIQQKANELQEMVKHSSQLASELQEQRQQYEWLHDINQRLEKILEF